MDFIRTGWRISKKGKKYHYFYESDKCLCGKNEMKNVFLPEEEINKKKMCKTCLKRFENDN